LCEKDKVKLIFIYLLSQITILDGILVSCIRTIIHTIATQVLTYCHDNSRLTLPICKYIYCIFRNALKF